MIRSLFVAITLIASAPVLADPIEGSATLAAPAKVSRVAGDTSAWRCDGTQCTGGVEPDKRSAMVTCTAVADTAGRVRAFTAGATSFAEADLARCNRHVK